MQKWITDVIQGRTFDATRQAKYDIRTIAMQDGYQVANIFRYNDEGETPQAKAARIDGITAGIFEGDIVVYQYPSLNSGTFEIYFVDQMRKRGAHPVCFVHDAEVFRDPNRLKWFDEIDYFNRFDVLIVHNRVMGDALRKLGVKTPMVFQFLLDYLDEGHKPEAYISTPETFKRGVTLAGNLLKSRFLADWHYQTPITAFGVTDDDLAAKLKANPQVDFRGLVWHEDLADQLPRTFGLAWDSNNYYTYADYTQYNHPHKVSMYLAHGLPVIVWKRAAVANLVVENHLGLAIDNLDELDAAIASVSDDQLAEMLDQVNHFGALIRDGWFTRSALEAAERAVLFPAFTLPGNMAPYTAQEQTAGAKMAQAALDQQAAQADQAKSAPEATEDQKPGA